MGFTPFTAHVESGKRAAKIALSGELDFLHDFPAARDRAGANDPQLLLVGANVPIRRLFELTGTESILDDQDVVRVFDE